MSERRPSHVERQRGTTGRPRTLARLGSVVAVLTSGLVSLVGSGMLPATIRVHWTFGAGPYYGPTFAPTVLVLGLFPVLVGFTALGATVLVERLSRPGNVVTSRLVAVASVLGLPAVLLAVQCGLVLANL